jgi:putative MFS transporter
MDDQRLDNQSSLIIARLQRIPATRHTAWFVLLISGALMIDALSSGSLAVILPIITPLLKLNAHEIGILAAASSLGIVIGLIPTGYLADTFGRKKLLMAGITCFCGATLLSAFSTNYLTLVLLRLTAGLGLAPAFIMPYSLVCELVPSRTRTTFAGLLESSVAIGYMAAPLLGLAITTTMGPQTGWRLFLFITGLPIVYVFLIWKRLPESPRWLCRMGRNQEADQIVASIERRVEALTGKPLATPIVTEDIRLTSDHPELSVFGHYRAVFQRPFLQRTIAMTVGNYGLFSLFYVITNYVPSLLVAHHITIGTVFLFSFIVAGGRIPWTIAGGFMADYVGRKITFVTLVSIAVVGAIMFGRSTTALEMTIWGMILQATSGAAPSYKMWYAELFPTYIRATGQSFVEGVGGRLLGGVIWSFFFPVLVSMFGVAQTMYMGAGITFLTVIVVSLFSPETHRKTLEQIERSAIVESGEDAFITPRKGMP